MPSSAYPAYYCSTGPSSVVPPTQLKAPAMHAYYYKNTAPLSSLGSPPMSASSQRAPMCAPPQTASQQQQQQQQQPVQSLNNGLGTNSHLHTPSPGRFNSPGPHVAATTAVTTTGTYSARSAARNCQPNGALSANPDIMSMSMHSPPTSFHYWASNPTPVTCASPYVHANPPAHTHSAATTATVNPSVSSTSGPSKTMTQSKPGTNGHAKISSQGSGSRPLWKDRPHVGRYSLIRTIGKGNFAKVKLAQHLTTGMQVAVKVIDKTLLNHSSMQKLFREVRVLKTLNHPNIIKLLEVIESERHLYLVMEYASGGEVFDYLVSHGKMKEADARVKFRQIVSAVQYCHQKMVVHRDLKAENLLLDADLNIKIADFGFSNYFSTSQKLDTFCGSPPYAAPELFLGRKYEGPEVDVWSLGVILYTLVSGTLPFDGKNLKELRERVLRGTYRVPFYMTRECEMLLKKMLVLNPAKRIPLTEVMRDPWLNTGFDTILRPFTEPPTDYCDPERIETMIRLGFQRHEIQEALTQQRFNNITATYILLSRYDPQIHGRLPGLSNVNGRSTKSESHSRPRQPDLSVNSNNNTLTNNHSSRPSSAVPTTAHSTTAPPNQTRRTPDEGSVSRKSSFASSRHAVQSADKDQHTPSVVSTTTTACASTTLTNTNVVGSLAVNSTGSSSSQPYASVRRSATVAEYSDRKSNSPSLNTGVNSGGLSFITRSPPPSTVTTPPPSSHSPPPSQAPPQEYPPPQHSAPAQASVIIHPTSVTAHLTLINPTNGPSCTAPGLPNQSPSDSAAAGSSQASVAATVPSQSTLSRSRPFPRKLSSHGVGSGLAGPTAPLAQSEDDPNSTGGALRSPGWQPPSNTDNRVSAKCNGNVTSPSNDQSWSGLTHTNSDGDSNSESDTYDREWGSGASSTDSGGSAPSNRPEEHHSHRHRRQSSRRRTPTGDSQPTEPSSTSVVLAAAPHSAALSRSASKSGHGGSAVPDDRFSDKQSGNGSNFTRMPSVRRRSSVRSRTTTSMPAATSTLTGGSTVGGTASPVLGGARFTRTSSGTDQPSATTNEGKPTASPVSTRFPRSTESNYEETDMTGGVAAPSSSNGAGDGSAGNKDRYPLNVAPKPRGLFRGTPNAADILNEANPFRIAADTTSSAQSRASSATPTPPAVPPHSSRPVPLNPTPAQSTGRAFTPPVVSSTSGGAMPQLASFTTTGTIRRPVAPPPPLATTSVTSPPTRTSYAYHSLRLPSACNTASGISIGREATPEVIGGRYNSRPVEPSVASLWASGVVPARDDGRATPTPPDSRESYALPFNRSIPERSTIQHVPTGRARERLEGSGTGARLVRHPGTHSIATQSIRIRTRSPSRTDQADGRDTITPTRPHSPDDLSISSVASSISTLGQNGPVDYNEGATATGFDTVSRHARRQSNTLGSPTQPMSRHYSMRPPSTRDGSNHPSQTERGGNGALNNFFRTLTTRISRSKLFRRSAVMQSGPNYADLESGRAETRDRLDPMLAPTLELDKVVVTRGSPSPDSVHKSYTARLPRSRSGVAPHRPASQVTPPISAACESVRDELRGGGAGRGSSSSSSNTAKKSHKSENADTTLVADADDDADGDDPMVRGSLTRRSSKRSSSSRDYSRSRSAHRSSTAGSCEDRTPLKAAVTGPSASRSVQPGTRRHLSASPADPSAQSGCSATTDSGKLSGAGKMHRSMRYVLRPTFARCPLDEVMVEVKQSLTKHNVDFEMVGEHKLQCVYGDPSRGCQMGTDQVHKSKAGADGTGVVHWEMEIGKLAGIGMNGIRFKRINGSMAAFKQIAKKLAADLRF